MISCSMNNIILHWTIYILISTNTITFFFVVFRIRLFLFIFLYHTNYKPYRHRIGLVRLRSVAINLADLSANLVFAIIPRYLRWFLPPNATVATDKILHQSSVGARVFLFFISFSSSYFYRFFCSSYPGLLALFPVHIIFLHAV